MQNLQNQEKLTEHEMYEGLSEEHTNASRYDSPGVPNIIGDLLSHGPNHLRLAMNKNEVELD